jgi:hypothetical protein
MVALVHRDADYGNTWQRAAVVRPCGHRLVCYPSDVRFEPASNLPHITFTAGGLHSENAKDGGKK